MSSYEQKPTKPPIWTLVRVPICCLFKVTPHYHAAFRGYRIDVEFPAGSPSCHYIPVNARRLVKGHWYHTKSLIKYDV